MSDSLRLLQNAVKANERYGWIQHKCGDIGQGFCAWGALLHEAIKYRYAKDSVDNIADKFKPHIFPIDNLVSYNDTPGRTKEEVLAVFQKVIDNEKCS